VSAAPIALVEAERQIAAGHLAEAESALRSHCARYPDDMAAWCLLGACRHRSGALLPALEAFAQVQILDPDHPQAALAEVAILSQSGRHDAALARTRAWLGRHPDDAQMHFSAGLVLQQQSDFAAALQAYDRALELSPAHAAALQNRGIVLTQLGRPADVLANNLRFVAACPQSVDAHFNLAKSCLATGRYEDAVRAAEGALALDPAHAASRLDRGYALASLARFDEAQRDIDAALAGDDGRLRARFAKWADSAGFYDPRELRDVLRAEDLYVLSGYQRAGQCDWSGYEAYVARCAALIDEAPAGAMQSISLGFNLLNLPIAASAQRRLADRIAAGTSRHATGLRRPERKQARQGARLRIGYLSSDFRRHPTSRLTMQIYALHDRRRIEVFAYALQPDDGSVYFQTIKRGCDRFTDVEALSSEAIAARIAGDGIDILVDLNGYGRDGCSEVFALRPAPIQVGYAAYPATLGGDLLDYVIADHAVIPPSSETLYAEKIVRLPHCYVPTSLRRLSATPTPTPTPSRREAGLPEQGLVFCAFNRHEKIGPQIFAVWMRILARVSGSVLWLQAGPGEANLQHHAAAAGIAPARLVFAPIVETAAYVARLRLADLYLDTLQWNTHTQGTDALWAGVPIITCPGEHWVSRLASGLLRAIGLEDCIVADLVQYEALACELATQPDKLDELKARLARNRTTHPLFDTERVVRDLDAAYLEMWRIHTSGAAPRSFDVQEGTPA